MKQKIDMMTMQHNYFELYLASTCEEKSIEKF